MDVLSDVLRIVRLTGSIFFTADLYDPWSVSSPSHEVLLRYMPKNAECVTLFHIVKEGGCWFKTESSKSFLLEKGSVIIFPQSCPHVMCSSMAIRPKPVIELLKFEKINGLLEYGGNGERTKLVCGYLFCDQRFNPLLGAMPEMLILLPQKENGNPDLPGLFPELLPNVLTIFPGSWLDVTINHLITEIGGKNAGSDTIITRLTELMYVEVLRNYMQGLPEKSNGWLAGLRDAEVGKALMYLHAHPEEKWNVEQLAEKVGVSRSAFAQRFSDLIGESPIKYLTAWRMQLAQHLLLQPDLSMPLVAEKVGYDSDIAFNRAFKRYVGVPPAKWRDHKLASA